MAGLQKRSIAEGMTEVTIQFNTTEKQLCTTGTQEEVPCCSKTEWTDSYVHADSLQEKTKLPHIYLQICMYLGWFIIILIQIIFFHIFLYCHCIFHPQVQYFSSLSPSSACLDASSTFACGKCIILLQILILLSFNYSECS